MNVTTTATQRLTGAGIAAIGFPSATSGIVRLDLCDRPAANPTDVPDGFSGGNDVLATISGTNNPVTVAGTIVPGPGTWTVGMCVRNQHTSQLSENDYSTGWVTS